MFLWEIEENKWSYIHISIFRRGTQEFPHDLQGKRSIIMWNISFFSRRTCRPLWWRAPSWFRFPCPSLSIYCWIELNLKRPFSLSLHDSHLNTWFQQSRRDRQRLFGKHSTKIHKCHEEILENLILPDLSIISSLNKPLVFHAYQQIEWYNPFLRHDDVQ